MILKIKNLGTNYQIVELHCKARQRSNEKYYIDNI